MEKEEILRKLGCGEEVEPYLKMIKQMQQAGFSIREIACLFSRQILLPVNKE